MTFTLNGGFWTPDLPIPTANLLAWFDATDISTITKGYVTKAQTATGTSGASSFTTSADISADLFPNMLVRLAGTDVYTISTVSGTTVNITGTLSTNYSASALAVEGISQWNDKSGNGNHATQGIGSYQPGYIPNDYSSNAAVSFFGSQTMALPSSYYNNIGTGQCTLFASSKCNLQVHFGFITDAQVSGVTDFGIHYTSLSTGGVSMRHDNTGSSTNKLVTNTNWAVIRGRRNGTTQAISHNNSTETTAAIADNLTLTSAGLGISFLDAHVMDIIIYNTDLGTTDRNAVQQYMAAKCGVTLS